MHQCRHAFDWLRIQLYCDRYRPIVSPRKYLNARSFPRPDTYDGIRLMTKALTRLIALVLSLVLSSAGLHADIYQASTNLLEPEQTTILVSERLSEQSAQGAEAMPRENEDDPDAVTWLFFALVGGVVFFVWLLRRRKAEVGNAESSSRKKAVRRTDRPQRTSSFKEGKISGVVKPRTTTTGAQPRTENAGSTSDSESQTTTERTKAQEKAKESPRPQRIGYTPSGRFIQQEPYVYPVAKMPRPACVVKFPRKGGRTGNRGVTEKAFESHVRRFFGDHVKVYNDRRMITSAGKRPYEPDLVLSNEEAGRNLFIDIEIDEPYSGAVKPQTATQCG